MVVALGCSDLALTYPPPDWSELKNELPGPGLPVSTDAAYLDYGEYMSYEQRCPYLVKRRDTIKECSKLSSNNESKMRRGGGKGTKEKEKEEEKGWIKR